jgi:hypothetical protein
MATTFKTFLNNDKTTTKTLLHEAIPITGSIVSGTYGDNNIKNYGHGTFQSVYDYPYLSSSANHIFDITCGYADTSELSSSSPLQNSKKINIYNQMAQVLVGYDETGTIREFDQDGDLTGGEKLREVYFINFSRLLTKDEIKKGSVSLSFATGSTPGNAVPANGGWMDIEDTNAQNDFRVNSPAGEYGILKIATSASQGAGQAPIFGIGDAVGLVYYQAGIAVITGSVFNYGDFGPVSSSVNTGSWDDCLAGATIEQNADGLRTRMLDLSFNNTTELNSTIYFCRANHNEFNYSSNPTYLTDSKLNVKNKQQDSPVSYITTVGLYSADNELLAVGKLSEPLKKTPETELTIRTRLDF